MSAPACRTCGRPLRDPVSRAAGLGPVCRRNLRSAPAKSVPAESPVRPEPGDGQTELPLNPHQPSLWSL